MIGISKYQKLPQDLWLQFADADAKTFSQHLASARGGGVPADQMVVLTNEAGHHRRRAQCLPDVPAKSRGQERYRLHPGRRPRHVDNRGAYILTYDSDPQDLSTTALPIGEIQSLVDDELSESRPRGSAGRCGPRRELSAISKPPPSAAPSRNSAKPPAKCSA